MTILESAPGLRIIVPLALTRKLGSMAHFEPAPTAIDVVSDLDTREVVRELVASLGQPLVALLTDVASTRVVDSWVEGVDPKAPREAILRYALRALHIIAARFDINVAQRWFVGDDSFLAATPPRRCFARFWKMVPRST